MSQMMITEYYARFIGEKDEKLIRFLNRKQTDPLRKIIFKKGEWVKLPEKDFKEMKQKSDANWEFNTRQVEPAEDRIENLEKMVEGRAQQTQNNEKRDPKEDAPAQPKKRGRKPKQASAM